jgi:hypothetical protein
VIRADCGYWSNKVITACGDHDVRYSITVRQTAPVVRAATAIDGSAWTLIRHPDPASLNPADHPGVDLAEIGTGQEAWVAKTTLDDRKVIVRRTRDADTQAALFPPPGGPRADGVPGAGGLLLEDRARRCPAGRCRRVRGRRLRSPAEPRR